MSSVAVVLIFISAVLHAIWNLLGKREHPTSAFFLATNTFGGLCLLPALILYGHVLPLFPPTVWLLLFCTGFCQAAYYAALAGAYRRGDLSIAYPLARSSPVIVVTVVALFLGRGDQVSLQCIIGIFLIVGGCFILPMKRFSEFRLGNYLNATCLLALIAACGTAGYSIIDDEALRRLRGAEGMLLGAFRISFLYAFFESLSSSFWLSLFVLAQRRERANLARIVRANLGRTVFIGAMIYLTYGLVLVSMAFVTNVSYVVAFRQLSIIIGAALGVIVLREPRYVPKFVGAATMCAGLILVGTG